VVSKQFSDEYRQQAQQDMRLDVHLPSGMEWWFGRGDPEAEIAAIPRGVFAVASGAHFGCLRQWRCHAK